MSQDLHFYKLKIFSEDYAKMFNRDEIHNALKALLEKRDIEGNESKLRDKIFEEIEVKIQLSANTPKIKKLLNKNLFLFSKSSLFLMTEEIWVVIFECILEERKPTENKSKISAMKNGDNQDDFKEKLNTIKPILKDYLMLDDLFQKNLLIVNIF